MSKEVFKKFMELMKPFMKSHDFSKKNNNFYKRHPQGNIGTINFQTESLGFTINVSTYSYALAGFFLNKYGEREVKKYPLEYYGHWRRSIKSLVSKQSPYYEKVDGCWEYDENTNVESLFYEISHLIAKFAIPAIDQHITDEQNTFTDTYDRVHLAALLMLLGEKEKLKTVLNKLLTDVSDPSVSNWVKADYDRIVKAAGLDKEGFKLSGVVNFPPDKDRLSKEELLALYDSLREEDSADWEAQRKGSVQLFSKVIKLATPLMESQGFTRRKRSDDFCKRYATGDVGIISFKKEYDRLEFCISAGIYMYAGAEFGLANYEKKIITDPQVIDCHWSVDNITSLDAKQSTDYGHIKDSING